MYASTLCESATRVSMERKPKRRTRERIVDIIQNELLNAQRKMPELADG